MSATTFFSDAGPELLPTEQPVQPRAWMFHTPTPCAKDLGVVESQYARRTLAHALFMMARGLLSRLPGTYNVKPPTPLEEVQRWHVEAHVRYKVLPRHLATDEDSRMLRLLDRALGKFLELTSHADAPAVTVRPGDARSGPIFDFILECAELVSSVDARSWPDLGLTLCSAEIHRRRDHAQLALDLLEKLYDESRPVLRRNPDAAQVVLFDYTLANDRAAALGDLGRWKEAAEWLATADELSQSDAFDTRYSVYHVINQVAVELCQPGLQPGINVEDKVREVFFRDSGFLKFAKASFEADPKMPIDRSRLSELCAIYKM